MFSHPLFIQSFFALTLVALAHHVANIFYLYWTLPWIDLPIHMLGGVWVGLTSLWFFYFSPYKQGTLNKKSVFITAFVAILIVSVSWEVFEILIGVQIGDSYFYLAGLDLIGGFIGAGIAYIYVIKKYLPHENT
jgi:hypothetical protein|tara:strand:+ start:9750 stop:10151 length:402 start_codon:yes stop_codon:yes gene_type:complete